MWLLCCRFSGVLCRLIGCRSAGGAAYHNGVKGLSMYNVALVVCVWCVYAKALFVLIHFSTENSIRGVALTGV